MGTHEGLPYYTIGQRSGLGIGGPRPLYVLALDRSRNAVVVGTADELGANCLLASEVSWLAGEPPPAPIEAEVQIRYHATPLAAVVAPLPGERAEVRFSRPLRDIAPGQAAVFYAGNRCLGGGLIERAENGD